LHFNNNNKQLERHTVEHTVEHIPVLPAAVATVRDIGISLDADQCDSGR